MKDVSSRYLYVWRLREIADRRHLDYVALAKMLEAADPEGKGVHPGNVSRHLNKNEWASLSARTVWLYVKALEIDYHELIVGVEVFED